MANLYEINAEIEELMNSCVDEETGEITGDFAEKLTTLNMDRAMKIDNTMAFIKNLDSDADAFDKEAKRLTALKKSAQAKAEWLRNWLSSNMTAGEETFTSARGKITWRKSERVIADVDAIPEEYITVKTEVKANLAALKKAIKNGEEVKGAHIETVQNIQIK